MIAALGPSSGSSVETVVVSTTGDRRQATPPQEMEGQGWFTAELQRALLEGRVDAAVHSAKDLPTQPPLGLEVVALLPRGDPRDAAVTADGRPLAELPAGSVVGTGSPRRTALLAAHLPGLRTVPLRGNVDTRLARLEAGDVDALVLAAAGLDRLEVAAGRAERLDPRRFVPAPAQGVLAIEVVTGSPAAGLWRSLHHAPTAAAVAAERALLRELGGGCLLPLGAWARLEGGSLVLTAALGVEGQLRTAEVGGPAEDPAAVARQAATRLR